MQQNFIGTKWEGRELRDVHLAEEHSEDGERAEEDEENVRDEGEKTRTPVGAVVVDQAAAHKHHRRPPYLHPSFHRRRRSQSLHSNHRRPPLSLRHRRSHRTLTPLRRIPSSYQATEPSGFGLNAA